MKADVPHGGRAGAAVPVSPPVTRRHGDGDGASFRLGASLSVGLSRAEAANYTALSDRVLVKENTARGSFFPPFFLSAVAFFLMFLMILQRSPNDGDESAGPALLAGPHVLLWPPAAPLAPGTVTP